METVQLSSNKQIAQIHLNRPDRYNALDLKMLDELLQAVEQVEQSDDRIVLLTGAGNAFCAGGDIQMMADFADQSFFDQVMDTIGAIVEKLYMMPKIVISAVHGSAAGLGLSLALTADYVIAEEAARFGMLFLGVGLAPDGGGHFWLKERLGVQQSKQFIWSMEQVKGLEAKQMGLVDVCTDQPVKEAANQLADRLLHSPLVSMLETKHIYHQQKLSELQYFLESEKKAQWNLRGTADHQEGVRAFLAKRKPVFKGE
ncbi:enoyl-CoA hydratase [Ornithinibacillus gellani]|nr:enoyl-CoA hydratase [Ornithinibacillus gellani]